MRREVKIVVETERRIEVGGGEGLGDAWCDGCAAYTTMLSLYNQRGVTTMINIMQVHNVAKRIRDGRATRDLDPRFIDGLILEQEDHSTLQATAGKTLGLLDHRNHTKPAQSGGQQ